MKVKEHEINEIEKRNSSGIEYSIEVKIIFKQKKDRENFIKMMREEIL